MFAGLQRGHGLRHVQGRWQAYIHQIHFLVSQQILEPAIDFDAFAEVDSTRAGHIASYVRQHAINRDPFVGANGDDAGFRNLLERADVSRVHEAKPDDGHIHFAFRGQFSFFCDLILHFSTHSNFCYSTPNRPFNKAIKQHFPGVGCD